MFIELTKQSDNSKFLVNTDDISVIDTLGNRYTQIVFRDNNSLYVKESYIDIWHMLKQMQCI